MFDLCSGALRTVIKKQLNSLTWPRCRDYDVAVKRVLVVEDNPGVAQLLQTLLDDEGYAVALARHGGEALTLLEQEIIDLIILDLRMPEMHGWALLDALRDRDAAPPVAVLTAVFDPAEREAVCSSYPVGAYIIKPFRFRELLDAVETLVRDQAGTASGGGPEN